MTDGDYVYDVLDNSPNWQAEGRLIARVDHPEGAAGIVELLLKHDLGTITALTVRRVPRGMVT